MAQRYPQKQFSHPKQTPRIHPGMSDKNTTFVPERVAAAVGLAGLGLIAAPMLSQTSSLPAMSVLGGAICVVLLAQARARRATASAAEVLRCATEGCLVHQGSRK
jgi:hypothetical protein